jgi:hypothetical protein
LTFFFHIIFVLQQTVSVLRRDFVNFMNWYGYLFNLAGYPAIFSKSGRISSESNPLSGPISGLSDYPADRISGASSLFADQYWIFHPNSFKDSHPDLDIILDPDLNHKISVGRWIVCLDSVRPCCFFTEMCDLRVCSPVFTVTYLFRHCSTLFLLSCLFGA